MQHPLNLPVLLDEIAGYTKAHAVMSGVSAPRRAAVARHLIGDVAAHPRTPFDRGFRLRLDELSATVREA